MALDKQKILNELGNVVNQLQSADCGCMGKLFSNSGQTNPNTSSMPNEYNGGMRSCCGHHGHHGHHSHHGCNAPCAGEPHTGARHCMGFCNPPKLYADTYNYLNKNMMQPVVQEVYDDLKSITPANTVMNNPMASQMGLSLAGNENQGNMMHQHLTTGNLANSHSHAHDPHIHFGNTAMTSGHNHYMQNNLDQHEGTNQGMSQIGQDVVQSMGQHRQEMSQTGQGMGYMRQGMDQMGHGTGPMGQGMGQMGQGMGQMGNGMAQMGQDIGQMRQTMTHQGNIMSGMGPQIVNIMSSSGKNRPMSEQGNPSMYANGNKVPNPSEMGQSIPNIETDSGPNNGYISQPNMASEVARQEYMNATAPNIHQHNPNQHVMRNMNANLQQTSNPNAYGQHGAGIAKFNEMFPGVMKKDLGFDPMAIAIQMNPANQQKSAMDAMQKMMMNNAGANSRIMDSPEMKPVVNATNAVTANLSQSQQLTNQSPVQYNVQQQRGNPAGGPTQNSQIPQQVYTAVTGAPIMNRQQIPTQERLQPPSDGVQEVPDQQLTGSLPTVYEGSEEIVSNQQTPTTHIIPALAAAQHIYKEPIFPADTSRNLLQSHHFMTAPRYEYNTLGQPVEIVSAIDYQKLPPNLPQTISGQTVPARYDPIKLHNVKATLSKTAIVGNRPVGKMPSRSQLHHIYNQYKGSQSFTQQNIRPSGYNGSSSEGRINVPKGHAQPQQFVERVVGDTAVRDQLQPVVTKVDPHNDQIGDVQTAKKGPDDAIMARASVGKTRNGLQDQIFSSPPTSAKWTFHGATPAPFSLSYRFKSK